MSLFLWRSLSPHLIVFMYIHFFAHIDLHTKNCVLSTIIFSVRHLLVAIKQQHDSMVPWITPGKFSLKI